jgi:hypothetical protein
MVLDYRTVSTSHAILFYNVRYNVLSKVSAYQSPG